MAKDQTGTDNAGGGGMGDDDDIVVVASNVEVVNDDWCNDGRLAVREEDCCNA